MNNATTARAQKMADRKRSDARIAEAQTAARLVVATGKCPRCGSKLRRNLSVTGWWQCEQVGAVGFRARAADAPCSWDGMVGR